MALYRDKRKQGGETKESRVWTMDFWFQGQRIRETTHQTSIMRAREVMERRKQELRDGVSGFRKAKQPRLFSVAADEWLERKKPTWAANTLTGELANLKHLLPAFRRKLVVDIEARDIRRYQDDRIEEEASPKTINNEIGTMRAILKRSGAWGRIQPDVTMLAPGEDIGRAITAQEERALLDACAKSRSRSLLPFVVLTLETGARKNTVRTLQWKNIDFENRCLKFGKDKTASGTGRVIPLNQRAMATLTFWASRFPGRQPEHYVFATERYGLDGEAGYLNGQAVPYEVNPEKPMGSWKTAWNAARKLAGKELSGEPLAVRTHDLRHSAISRMISAGVPLPMVAKIVGWAPSTMVKMAAKYGHFSTDELRDAMEKISRPEAHSSVKSPVFSPVSPNQSESKNSKLLN
jgi:integrase